MRLIAIRWAFCAKALITDHSSQSSMAATIKIVKKRTTRFKYVYGSQRPLRLLSLFQAPPIRPLQERQGELEETKGYR